MSSPSNPERGSVCAVNPFAGGFRFQSSQPHLKRFIMFDHSNGKGRVFFHPAVSQELFGSMHTREQDSKGLIPEKDVRTEWSASSLMAYREMVEGAFKSLQSLRASRQNDAFLQKAADAATPATFISSQKPRVPETILKGDGKSWNLDAQDAPQSRVASETLVCEEKPKVLAILPSVELIQDCSHRNFHGWALHSSISEITLPKTNDAAAATSELMQENSEDLDALLSSDEDDDDDVRSTGHSPDESPGKEGCPDDNDEDEEVEHNPCKRRRTFDEYGVEPSTKVVGLFKDLNNKSVYGNEYGNVHSNRRQKIKKTVKALRRMIPGGALLDTAYVLDRTIMYVKTLRDRVNQLEASRGQPQSCHPRS